MRRRHSIAVSAALGTAMVLAMAGCGRYEPAGDTGPANLARFAEEKITCIDELRLQVADVKTPEAAFAVLDKLMPFESRMNTLTRNEQILLRGATPQQRDQHLAQFKPRTDQAIQQLRNELIRLQQIPNRSPEVFRAAMQTLDLLLQWADAPGSTVSKEASSYASLALSVILLAIFATCVGFLQAEGIWGNAVRLVNVIMAALVAMNFFEPLARWLTGQMPSYTALCDFLALWALFAGSFLVMREITDRLSRVNVRFLKLADRIGGALLAAWIGWMMVCFTTTTLHTAPLARNYLFGAFRPGDPMFFGAMAPDLQWLAFTQKVSRGVYCRSATAEEWKQQKYVFDPECTFAGRQTDRRAALESHFRATRALRVNPDNARPR